LEHIDEILEVPGLDGFMIGPYDLSASLGIPGQFTNQSYLDAIKKINRAGVAAGCPTGIHVVEPELDALNAALDNEYIFIAFGVDIRLLDRAARKGPILFDKATK
jgi:2-dehydro-3-deoxyglucarate aldolase